jgi:PAS domain S-box-containing protein
MRLPKISLSKSKARILVATAIFMLAAFSGNGQNVPPPAWGVAEPRSQGSASPFATFRDIPGVTAEEIAAIETLQKNYTSFSFGANPSAETFRLENGEDGGFTTLLCEWLTEIIGIQFRHEVFAWDDLLAKINDRTVDFMANLAATEDRRKIYYMTDPIAERQIKMMRLKGSPSLEQIAQERLPRYALIRTSGMTNVITDMIVAATRLGTFEPVYITDIDDAYQEMRAGRADVFFSGSVAVDAYPADDVYTAAFFPLLFTRASLVTANPELAPIISVVTKALGNGAMPHLRHLQNQGNRDFMKHKLLMQLSGGEREYIASHPVVPVVANYDKFPVCFYNTREGEWQGIFFDLLDEIAAITGFSFNLINKNNDDWPVIYEMVKSGQASLIADLTWTRERADYFIWPESGPLPDYLALVSKSDFHNITINEIRNIKVGVARGTVYASTFRQWFPDHPNTVEYENMDAAIAALGRDEIDMVMSSQRRLMFITHYLELPGFKANIIFDQPLITLFGVNKDEDLLCSIIDKTLRVIDTKGISERWMRKTYDYRVKVAEARLPWLIGASAMTLIVLTVLILFLRGRGEEKRLARLVAEKTTTLTAILDATPDLIFCKDLNSCFTECNKATEKHFNCRKTDIMGKNETEALGLPLELTMQFKAMNQQIFNEKQLVTVEEIIPSFDGQQRLFETKKMPLIQNDEVSGLVIMARDITRRKAAEDEVRKAAEETRSASEAKSRFIASMNHEMRTPMNVIVGLTDLVLEEEDIPGKIKETLKKINTAGNTLMGLINDVLDFSKIEAGKEELNPAPYDVASLLNDVITLNMVRIGGKPIEFKLDIGGDMPARLLGDDLRVKQILNNLLSNAFKYTRKGLVTLGVDCTREGTAAAWLSFTINDTGIGIRQEDQAKLFTDFHQVDTRANRQIEGTGLGLSITKKIVELMNGQITVASEYGQGTTFRVRLRQGIITAKVIGQETVESLRGFRYADNKKQGPMARGDLSYATVLVVDDFPTNLDVAAGMLRKYRMRVDCVLSGAEAVERLAAGDPVYDAVFMDYMMPEMDGVEAAARIRALGTDYARNIPIIALTANAVAGSEQMFLDNGFNAFLSKPFSVMNLDAVIQRWVRDKSRE